MKRVLYTAFSSMLLLLTAHCGTKKTVATEKPVAQETAPSLLAIAQATDASATQQMLDQGKQILEVQCAKCHAAKDPKKFTTEKWEKSLTAMIPKAKLSEDQAKVLRLYTAAYQQTK